MNTYSEIPEDRQRTDRRKARTRRQLRQALLGLILEKGYDAVTIEDITERADLGRTTFYLHYRDKDELLLESIQATADELRAQVPFDRWTPGESLPSTILLVFRHAAENQVLYRIILNGTGSMRMTGRLREIISSETSRFLTQQTKTGQIKLNPTVPLDLYANYFASALLGFITWWLEEAPSYTPEEMSVMFQQMFFQGGVQVLGLQQASA